MRAISLGLIAAGLAALVASSASAGFSGRSGGAGGFMPFPMGLHGLGGGHQHFAGVPAGLRFGHDFRTANFWFGRNGFRAGHLGDASYLGSSIIDTYNVQPTEAAPQLSNVQIFLAPAYVPPTPVARSSAASGPRIIVIGAQPKETLPIVVYGSSPDRMN